MNIQNLIDSLKGVGVVYIPKGIYVINSPIIISNVGVTLLGDGTNSTIIKISESFVGDCFISIDNDKENYLGKIRIENIKFDASDNDNVVHGIKFNTLIYNNIFRNLDFEGFTGSWIYNESNLISEHIEFSMIQGNCRNKMYKSPLFKLDRINESIFISCKLYGKQYHRYPYSNVNLVELDTPQNVSILGCSFNNSNGNGICIKNTKNSRIRSIWIQGCTFEDIENADGEIINICGSEDWKGEYGFIGNNSYVETKNTTIVVDNYSCLEINDNKTAVIWGSNTNSCIVRKTIDNNSNITDYGVGNVNVSYYKGGVYLLGKDNRRIWINSNYNVIRIYINENEYFDIQGENTSEEIQSLLVKRNGMTIGGFNNFGVQMRVLNENIDSFQDIPEGTCYINKSDSTLCIKINNTLKKIKITQD